MGVLSRQEMVDIIKRGESVHYNGVIHWQEGTLPSEAEMAIGDESRMRAAEDSLENQIALLAAEKAKAAQDLAKEQERRDAEEKKAEERRVAEEEKAAEESRKRAEAEAAGESKPAGHGKGK
jgi:peptidoglycan hydrolase CwlO-like protein